MGAEEMGVRLHRELQHLFMEVGDGGGANTARSYAKSGVLDYLEPIEGRRRGVRGPNRCSVVE